MARKVRERTRRGAGEAVRAFASAGKEGPMLLSMAPMEGITGFAFRQVHAEFFGALDRYYTPFVTPPHAGHDFVGKASRELDPANNQGLKVIPQLLTKNADEFVWAAGLLAERGYTEVNLNLGCPAGTVTAKGRGSGFLRNLADLDRFLAEVCERSPVPVSVKTRLGIADDAEYEQILALYCRYPLAELIVHPRLQRDQYRGHARRELMGLTMERAPFPVAYNGDVFGLDDLGALARDYPQLPHVMLGRGLLTNPALGRQARGGAELDAAELREFHDKLFSTYVEQIGGNAVFRMREWWFYAKFAFENPLAVHRCVRKVRQVEEYRTAARRIFAGERLASEPRFCPPQSAEEDAELAI